MIEVTIGTNLHRVKVIAEPTETLRTTLEEAEIEYGGAILYLDGASLFPGDLDKSYAEHNIQTKCFLIAAVKMDNNS